MSMRPDKMYFYGEDGMAGPLTDKWKQEKVLGVYASEQDLTPVTLSQLVDYLFAGGRVTDLWYEVRTGHSWVGGFSFRGLLGRGCFVGGRRRTAGGHYMVSPPTQPPDHVL